MDLNPPQQAEARQQNLMVEKVSLSDYCLLRNERVLAPAVVLASLTAPGFPLLLPELPPVNYEELLRRMRCHFLRTCLTDRLLLLGDIAFQAP